MLPFTKRLIKVFRSIEFILLRNTYGSHVSTNRSHIISLVRIVAYTLFAPGANSAYLSYISQKHLKGKCDESPSVSNYKMSDIAVNALFTLCSTQK